MTLIQLGGYVSEYITYLLAIINSLPYKSVMVSNYCSCFVHAPKNLIKISCKNFMFMSNLQTI